MDFNENEKKLIQSFDVSKVLIVDDDLPTQLLLSAAVTQWGYQAVVASDGEEAWEILQKPDAPHLLILDWLMDKLNGLELCERIRKKLDDYPYIIFLTQVSGAANIMRGLEAGADEFLLKPINLPELRLRVTGGEKIVKFLQIIKNQKKGLQQAAVYIDTLERIICTIGEGIK